MLASANQRSGDNDTPHKYSINLLQVELLPKKVWLTLSNVVALWLLVLAVMVGWAIVVHYNQQSITEHLAVVQQENNTNERQLKALGKQLAARKVDNLLSEKLATVKLLLNNKQALHSQLTNSAQTHVAGFAMAMDELAQLHHQDIRLNRIHINNNDMSFSGLALTPEAVPAWLAGFESSLLLSGKSFSHFSLSENEQEMTEFTVSSKVSEVANNE